jgi:hypothetical protein
MSRRVQPTRQANIARTIKALRQGTPEQAPHTALRWAGWVAGMRAAARRGGYIPGDLPRRHGPPPDLAGRCPTPARFKRQVRAREGRATR